MVDQPSGLSRRTLLGAGMAGVAGVAGLSACRTDQGTGGGG
ncbi:MAG TPA: spermidine/putrescine ABC transporter substrate-binding protein, partial [Candidatus Avipropionibacterium avicola]|nr:spermidine/putrescine ABC transporter substrate-binding protein [Candidatus Avipropionibacterium avicola]